jgi:serine-type D-Ala-D-Ala carboxypeptidase (penicillin-binding protein 5/6)
MKQAIHTFRNILIIALCTTVSVFFNQSALANPVIPAATVQPAFVPTPPNINAKGYILIDANSGKVITEKNADTRLPPASLTKLMSMYIVSQAIKSGAIHWEDKVRISTKAWKAEGSRMFVKVNDEVPVKDLVQGVAVASGNDATIALAEHIASAEDSFANLMNTQAKDLGMNNSHFTDSTGLPDPEHYSTPRDFAILAQNYIKNFPEDYHFYSEKWFTHNGIRQPNRNRLLWQYPYADGFKTGHTNDAGYCLIASAVKDGMRLISVVMGTPNDRIRTEESVRLLNYGFRFYETHKLYNADQAITKSRVWKGKSKEVELGLAQDLYVTSPNGQAKNLQTNMVINTPLKAPIVKGQVYGTLNVAANNQTIMSAPIIALQDDPKGAFWRNITDTISYSMHKIFSKSNETINNS